MFEISTKLVLWFRIDKFTVLSFFFLAIFSFVYLAGVTDYLVGAEIEHHPLKHAKIYFWILPVVSFIIALGNLIISLLRLLKVLYVYPVLNLLMVVFFIIDAVAGNQVENKTMFIGALFCCFIHAVLIAAAYRRVLVIRKGDDFVPPIVTKESISGLV
eukprot:TRINITY_DN5011_c0_g2_i1.p1 TRINITY_DN5011_c0_g2~~TRINITY_DN5011_c0_g2_i1.p1  ORF type:complete len:158 (+),score=13.46 TRINITY_DN5011_c0_g2_i1:16-489(+)